MTVEDNREAERLRLGAMGARRRAIEAEEEARERTIEYIDAARAAGWSWGRIAGGLGITVRGVTAYYERNRRRVHGGDLVGA